MLATIGSSGDPFHSVLFDASTLGRLHGAIYRSGNAYAHCNGQQAEKQCAHDFHVIVEEIIQM